MKTIVILLAVSFAAVLGEFTEQEKETHKKHVSECLTENNIDRAIFEKIEKGEVDKNDVDFGCFHTCMLQKFGTLGADGITIDFEKVREHLSRHEVEKEKSDEIINCLEKVETTEKCQKGKELMKCFMKSKGDHKH